MSGERCAGSTTVDADSVRRGGELGVEPVGQHLREPLRAVDVAQVVLAEVAQLDARRELGRGAARHDLAAVGNGHDACRGAHVAAEVVAAALLGPAGVQAHADAQRRAVHPSSAPSARCTATAQRIASVGGTERDAEAVSAGSEDVAVGRVDLGAQDRVVTFQRSRIPSPWSCHSRVDPCTSVNRNVTVPDGMAPAPDTRRTLRARSGAPPGDR